MARKDDGSARRWVDDSHFAPERCDGDEERQRRRQQKRAGGHRAKLKSQQQ